LAQQFRILRAEIYKFYKLQFTFRFQKNHYFMSPCTRYHKRYLSNNNVCRKDEIRKVKKKNSRTLAERRRDNAIHFKKRFHVNHDKFLEDSMFYVAE
jgi:hypothetical protein